MRNPQTANANSCKRCGAFIPNAMTGIVNPMATYCRCDSGPLLTDIGSYAPQTQIEKIHNWFNHWLMMPLTHRDKVIIQETIYAMNNPADLERAQ